MKSLILAALLLISAKSFAYVPSSVTDLAGKEGAFDSDLGRGRCKVELDGDDLVIRTDVAGLKKIMVADVHELKALNNSQYLTIKKRTRFCEKSESLKDFREIISMEADSIYITQDFHCSGEKKTIAASCLHLR